MPHPWAKFRRLRQGLRFRLTISYLLIFAILLAVIGLIFRMAISQVIRRQTQELAQEEWQAIPGFLQIRNGKVVWSHPEGDIETAFLMDRLQGIYLVADVKGHLVEASAGYRRFGLEDEKELQQLARAEKPIFQTKLSAQGDECLLLYRRARLSGEPYLLVHGISLSENLKIANALALTYFEALPVLLLICGVLGWIFAKPAMEPVNRLAAVTQEISSSNLKMRLASNDSRDEVDLLVVAFNKMLARLEDSFEQIRRFSTDVSHELRTPLTILRGNIEVSLMTANTKEEFQSALEGCLEDVDRISSIIRALLLLAQAESGQLQVQKQSVHLSAMVQDIASQFEIPSEASKIALCRNVPSEIFVAGDPIQLERLLFNLISNALKFTPENGTITISMERKMVDDRAMVQLQVQDTGQGIDAQDVPFIFDRFYKSAGRKNDGGLGLGLSFVAWIVKAHEGRIHVESEPGKGATFTVLLPEQPA